MASQGLVRVEMIVATVLVKLLPARQRDRFGRQRGSCPVMPLFHLFGVVHLVDVLLDGVRVAEEEVVAHGERDGMHPQAGERDDVAGRGRKVDGLRLLLPGVQAVGEGRQHRVVGAHRLAVVRMIVIGLLDGRDERELQEIDGTRAGLVGLGKRL